jgi:hypothetical protein
VRPENADRSSEMNGSGVSRTCSAGYSTAPPPSSPRRSDSHCGSRPSRPRRVRSARGPARRRPRLRAPPRRSAARQTDQIAPPGHLQISVHQRAKFLARAFRRDSLCIGVLRLPLRFRQGASQPSLPANLRLQLPKSTCTLSPIRTKSPRTPSHSMSIRSPDSILKGATRR